VRILVTGLLGQYPLGGVTWDYMQYVLGFERLGHEVYYFEDTGQWPYQPNERGLGADPSYTVDYLARLMRRFGLEDRWAYCYPWQSQWFGLDAARRREVIDGAELTINVSGTLARPERYRGRGRLVYLDSDPVFTQVKLARGQDDFRRLVDAHDVCLSFGECMGAEVPQTGHVWLATRQPIVLSEWEPVAARRDVWTTVLTWASYNPVEFEGVVYGQKDVELARFEDLPRLAAPSRFELAVSRGKRTKLPDDLLRHKGWGLVDPAEVSADIDAYRDYVRTSFGEWSVAKNGYVRGQSGWFSCRSACYLAAARPVVVQETGFSKVLPVGDGLLSFRSVEQAVDCVRRVAADWEHHSLAARALAEQFFDSDRVLTELIEAATG